MLELLRKSGVQDFEGCGVKVRFSAITLAREPVVPRPPEQKNEKPGPITAADRLKARLGDVDMTIVAGLGEG